MTLEGSLDAFALPDILHLLAFTTKTGALHVRSAKRPNAASTAGVVRVRQGAITAASSDVTHQALARRIVAAGLVDEDALREAVNQVRADASLGLVGLLVETGAVSADAAGELAREQTVDAVCELLRWRQGEFSFALDELDPDALPVTLPVDEVVSEGRRRLEAWPALTAVIPSPAAVLSLAVNPPADPCCTPEEWGLLSLVDGRRTVGEVVSLLGRGEYALVRALAGLVERGLLVGAGADNGGVLADLVRRQTMLAEIERPMGHAAPRPIAPAIRAESAPPPAADPAVRQLRDDVQSADLIAGTARMAGTARTANTANTAGTARTASTASTASTAGAAGTAGAVALNPAPAAHQATHPAADTDSQDSVVTKSLVLRLIAGVRGL